MPLYDFRCRQCGDEFERLVRQSVTPDCPGCGSTDLERRDVPPSVALRSGGLSPAARRDVHRQQRSLHADKAAFQTEIEKKHLDD
jgi:putative FmdB family regulatory protein